MLVACLWDHWSDRHGVVLDSFAAIYVHQIAA
jgi:hypothetical protein